VGRRCSSMEIQCEHFLKRLSAVSYRLSGTPKANSQAKSAESRELKAESKS
jgi:hypothetical protein